MSLTLQTITFRHAPTNPATSAFAIRRNKDFESAVPEYDAAAVLPQAESCAAYAIGPTKGSNVVVHLGFEIGTAGDHFEVRAKGGGVLGRLKKFPIAFGGGATSGTVIVSLSKRSFGAVGRHDVTWRWQYRRHGGAWLPLANTHHRIYLTVEAPSGPWNLVFGDKHNPWTDLLDETCVAAAGSRTRLDAGVKIAQRIHLGFNLKYDIVSGAPRYQYVLTGDAFNLSRWIDYVIRGNAPSTPVFCGADVHEYPDNLIVNCYDCGASLGIMASSLGVPLQYHFHQPFGKLNYVLPIGRGKCNNPFPGCNGTNFAVGPDDPRTGFGNHAYTKFGGVNAFDACMREWVSFWCRLGWVLLWLLILILTLGLVNRRDLLWRSEGWLVDLPQPRYDAITIDVSTPSEAASAGGSPAAQVLDFQVT